MSADVSHDAARNPPDETTLEAIESVRIDSAPKCLNNDGYASKQSLSNGMLDMALLTANVTHLKFVLSYGPAYQFHTLMIVLISISIMLMVGCFVVEII